MSKRRVKNVTLNDDNDDFYDDFYDDEDDNDYKNYASKPKPKPKSKQPIKETQQLKGTKSAAKQSIEDKRINKIEIPMSIKKIDLTTNSKASGLSVIPPSFYPIPSQSSPTTSHSETDEVDGKLEVVNLVIIGHVDAGKSTLMGHLLVKMGAISSKRLEKYRDESNHIGKGSFFYAWILDEGKDERERGVTIDVCVKYFETKNKKVTILDAPGHKDFVPNMLLGAVQADTAVLVVDCKGFDAVFDRGGQIQEHIRLVRALGINNLIVALNKLDLLDWDQTKYTEVKDKLLKFLIGPQIQYKSQFIQFIPVGAFKGINLTDKDNDCAALNSWYQGPSLIGAIDRLRNESSPLHVEQISKQPLIACVSDVWSVGQTVTVSAKIDSGSLSVGDQVLILPANESAVVKGLKYRDQPVKKCIKGEYIGEISFHINLMHLHIGSVLTTKNTSVELVSEIVAKIVVFEVDLPICEGQQVMSYVHCSSQSATIVKILGLCAKSTKKDLEHQQNHKRQQSLKKTKALGCGDVAVVKLQFLQNIPVNYPTTGIQNSLSRIILREKSKTIAAGLLHHLD